jgi:hypothetical protein
LKPEEETMHATGDNEYMGDRNWLTSEVATEKNQAENRHFFLSAGCFKAVTIDRIVPIG